MLQRIKGNLIDLAEQGKFSLIVHGCNCQNTMGSGIAGELKKRYPVVYKADCKAADMWPNPIARLGNFSYAGVKTLSNFIVINAYTQVDYLPRGVDHFEYAAFEVILKKLAAISSGQDYGFPMIGCGLAGGNESRIIPMLEAFAETVSNTKSTVTLVEFDG